MAMVKRLVIALLLLQGLMVQAQEVLLPLQRGTAGRASVKDASQPVALPFFDDFAKPMDLPDAGLWQAEGGVTLSRGGGLLPPTVGVATLDAIGGDGRLYDGASSGRFPADTLCSQAIKLGGLRAADSVVMSFYYLPGGGQGDLWRRIGDAPEEMDSLVLEFYKKSEAQWVAVWARGGTEVDTLIAETGRAWQYVAISITDTGFLNDDFAFRFRNYCSMTPTAKMGMNGNCDYWHLDYIFVDRGRTRMGDPVFHDVAFVEPAPSMLATYQAMPMRQYRQSDMADSLKMTITNLFSSQLATQYEYAVVDADGDTVYSYDGGYENAPTYLPGGVYQTAQGHAAPAVAFAFPESAVATTYTVVHTVREGVGGDDWQENDTVRFEQVFGNYYAYDDGTAENGYGLTSTASTVLLAYRFDLNMADTLMAVDFYFNSTKDGENETIPFRIVVWENNDGKPGSVIYRDRASRRPVFDGLNVYHRYLLEDTVWVSGSVFVGFEQDGNDYINLGFDRNHNVSDRIFYLTGIAWQQSILSGALMIRPCFGVSATVGIEERGMEAMEWKVMPNPASEWVRVEGVSEQARMMLYDMTGREVATGKGRSLNVAGLAEGVYILRCVDSQGFIGNKKLIIKH